MNLKKNAFSYFMWFLYSVFVCMGLLHVLNTFCGRLGYPEAVCFGACGLWLLICGLLVFLVYRLRMRSDREREWGIMPALVAESLIAVILLAAGFSLRAIELSGAGEEAAYFELARVAEGQVIPPVVHGAVYSYLWLLHMVFFIFGNKFLAGIWLQIILQMIAGLFLYLAIRKLAGVIPAITMLAFLMMSPLMVSEALLLSPRMLFLTVFAFVLFVCSLYISGKKGPAGCLIMGILIAGVCYQDIMGVVLLLFAVSGLLMKKSEKDKTVPRRLISAIVFVLSCVAVFALLIVTDAFVSDKRIWDVLAAWWKLYCPNTFTVSVFTNMAEGTVDILILLLLMAVGIFSFWCSNCAERQSIWILPMMALVLLQCFGMTTTELNGCLQLYLSFALLAGAGVTAVFLHGEEKAKAYKTLTEETTPVTNRRTGRTVREMDAAMGNSSADADAVREHRGSNILQVDEKPKPAKPKVNYIENPLPLPKKHVKRIPDYDMQPGKGQGDFDIAVKENDDFDI